MTILTVSGEGLVSLPPDMVAVSISVQTENENATQAADENLRLLNSTLSALQGSGVKRDDIQAGYYSVAQIAGGAVQVCDNTTGLANATGNATGNATDNITCRMVMQPPVIQISNQVLFQLNTTEAGAVRSVLDGVTAAGASEAVVVGYGLQDTSAAIAQARQRAFDNARANAEVLASISGVRLGRMLELSEPVLPQVSGNTLYSPVSSVTPSAIDVIAMVTVTYEVLPQSS